MKSKGTLLIILFLTQSGCASLRHDDCPIPDGIACQSLKSVDYLASQGYFDDKELSLLEGEGYYGISE